MIKFIENVTGCYVLLETIKMTLKELESMASRGFKRNEDANVPSNDKMMAVIEIRNHAEELLMEMRSCGQQWDKETIARKTSAIMFFCARLAGMYGLNLEHEMRKKFEDNKPEPLSGDETAGKIKDAKPFIVPRIIKPKRYWRKKDN